MKKCWRCSEEKPLDAFNKDSSSRDGHQKLCRACLSIYNSERNYAPQKDGEKVCAKCEKTLPMHAFGLHKRHSDGRQSVCRPCKGGIDYSYWHSSEERQWRHKARMAVRSEIRAGRMKRQPCSKCAAPKAQAHHHKGYEREHWLDIEWLCVGCHAKEHAHVA